MELAHRWSDRNLTRLELISSILILAILLGMFGRYAGNVFFEAEQSMVNRTVVNVNTALTSRAVLAILLGNYEELELLKAINPMEEMQSLPRIDSHSLVPLVAGALIVTPSNYGGVIYSDDVKALEKGKWYYNKTKLYLVYIFRNIVFFTGINNSESIIRFRIILDYYDKNENQIYESNVDDFRAMKLVALDNSLLR